MTDASSERRVMLVEDDAECLSVVTDILEASSFHVVGAVNGRQALDALRGGERPGLIVLDLMLPLMDGWQFRAEQLKDPDLADIPVVVFTADKDARGAARAMDAADYLTKPVELDELLAKIGQFFR